MAAATPHDAPYRGTAVISDGHGNLRHEFMEGFADERNALGAYEVNKDGVYCTNTSIEGAVQPIWPNHKLVDNNC